MKLMEFTKEGLIVDALAKGALRFKDLKRATGLSDAWLSKKLHELCEAGIIDLREGYYHINVDMLHRALAGERQFTARLIAHEVARENGVLLIALFGSLARSPKREADIDLFVVTTEADFDPIRVSLKMFRKFGVSVDILHVTLKDMLGWFSEKPPALFGIMSGYEVLFDRGSFAEILKLLKYEVLEEWVYLKGDELWLRKELLPRISKRPRNT